MPVKMTHNRRGDAKSKSIPKFYPNYWLNDSDSLVLLLDIRKKSIAAREIYLSYQKEAGQTKDRETAKFFKEESNEELKWYRAACLLIGYIGQLPLPGDCPSKDPYEWPPELWPYICHLEILATAR